MKINNTMNAPFTHFDITINPKAKAVITELFEITKLCAFVAAPVLLLALFWA